MYLFATPINSTFAGSGESSVGEFLAKPVVVPTVGILRLVLAIARPSLRMTGPLRERLFIAQGFGGEGSTGGP